MRHMPRTVLLPDSGISERSQAETCPARCPFPHLPAAGASKPILPCRGRLGTGLRDREGLGNTPRTSGAQAGGGMRAGPAVCVPGRGGDVERSSVPPGTAEECTARRRPSGGHPGSRSAGAPPPPPHQPLELVLSGAGAGALGAASFGHTVRQSLRGKRWGEWRPLACMGRVARWGAHYASRGGVGRGRGEA